MDCGPSLPELAQTKRHAALIAQLWCSAEDRTFEHQKNFFKLQSTSKYVILRRRFIPNKINKNSCGTGSVHPASVDPSKYVNGATAGPLLPRGSFLSILGQLPTPTLSMFEH